MNNLQIKIISKALDHPELFTEWENDFISAIADRPDTYELSDKQNAVVNRIWDKLDKA